MTDINYDFATRIYQIMTITCVHKSSKSSVCINFTTINHMILEYPYTRPSVLILPLRICVSPIIFQKKDFFLLFHKVILCSISIIKLECLYMHVK